MKVRKLILGFMATAFLGIAAWAQKPVLKFHADSKKFKIVQFTDLHLKWQDERSEVAYERINQVLDEEKGTPHQELLEVAQSLPYNLTADEVSEISGDGNYALAVRSSDDKKDAAVLYCFDSNAYSSIKGIDGYDYIKFDQIDWYRSRSQAFTEANGGTPLLSLAFFHIPLPEYHQAIADENATVYGIRREKACAPALNSGLFTAMKEQDNDYAVYWQGILLAYGRFSGGPTEYNHLPNGARIIELDEASGKYATWIRTKKGVEQYTIFPDSYVKD